MGEVYRRKGDTRYELLSVVLGDAACIEKREDDRMMIYLLTAVGLTPGGSSTVHIYTQTVHSTHLHTNSTQYNTINKNNEINNNNTIKNRTTQLTRITSQLTRTTQLTTIQLITEYHN